MKKTIINASSFLLLLLASCGNSSQDATKNDSAADSSHRDSVAVKDVPSPARKAAPDSNTVTILLDGNTQGIIYFYEGIPGDPAIIRETSLDPKTGLFKYASKKNYAIYSEMEKFRELQKRARMTDSLVRAEKQKIIDKYAATAPVFVIRRSSNTNDAQVNAVVEELKRCDVQDYSVEPATKDDMIFLSKKTHVHYPELDH